MPASGSLVGWGSNQEGQFGAGLAVGRPAPAPISRITVGLTSKTVKILAAGVSHSVAVTEDNQIFAWGQNDYGQLGVGDTENRRLPSSLSDPDKLLKDKTIVEISLGAHHTLVRTADNMLFAWGRNDYGQLGNGTTVSRSFPVAVNMAGALAGSTVSKIAAGGQHNLACTTDGNVYTWGFGNSGQTTTYNTVTSSPILAPNIGVSVGRLVQSVAAGANHSVALIQGGTSVFAWGTATANGLTNTTWNPNAVVITGTLSGKTITALASSPGSNHTLVLTSDGMVAGWGQTPIPSSATTPQPPQLRPSQSPPPASVASSP